MSAASERETAAKIKIRTDIVDSTTKLAPDKDSGNLSTPSLSPDPKDRQLQTEKVPKRKSSKQRSENSSQESNSTNELDQTNPKKPESPPRIPQTDGWTANDVKSRNRETPVRDRPDPRDRDFRRRSVDRFRPRSPTYQRWSRSPPPLRTRRPRSPPPLSRRPRSPSPLSRRPRSPSPLSRRPRSPSPPPRRSRSPPPRPRRSISPRRSPTGLRSRSRSRHPRSPPPRRPRSSDRFRSRSRSPSYHRPPPRDCPRSPASASSWENAPHHEFLESLRRISNEGSAVPAATTMPAVTGSFNTPQLPFPPPAVPVSLQKAPFPVAALPGTVSTPLLTQLPLPAPTQVLRFPLTPHLLGSPVLLGRLNLAPYPGLLANQPDERSPVLAAGTVPSKTSCQSDSTPERGSSVMSASSTASRSGASTPDLSSGGEDGDHPPGEARIVLQLPKPVRAVAQKETSINAEAQNLFEMLSSGKENSADVRIVRTCSMSSTVLIDFLPETMTRSEIFSAMSSLNEVIVLTYNTIRMPEF